MKTTKFTQLENDNNFKKKYLGKYFWLKQSAIYPPSLIIFGALFALIYLLNLDLLISVYTIPFALMLLLGAIWLKSVKRFVLKKLFEKEDSFLICLSKLTIIDNNRLLWMVFTTSRKRHEKCYAENLRKELEAVNFFESDLFINWAKGRKTKAFLIPADVINEEEVYLMVYTRSEVRKSNVTWEEDEVLPLLYIDNNEVVVIKKRDLDKP